MRLTGVRHRQYSPQFPASRRVSTKELISDTIDSAPKSKSESALKIRQYFPETWLWNQTNVGYEHLLTSNRMSNKAA
jgi:hypothetical protein